MKKKALVVERPGDYLGCLGDFNAEDRVCVKYCALNLRCAIESNHHIRSEILEELLYSEMISDRIQ